VNDEVGRTKKEAVITYLKLDWVCHSCMAKLTVTTNKLILTEVPRSMKNT
jgi:hypothetical protein